MRRLTELEKGQIAVLSAQGLTIHAIAQEIGRDDKTVGSALRKPEVSALIEAAKGELADVFEATARRMLASITDDDIVKINSYQRMVSAGIATDKMRLLRDQSTDNIALRHADIATLKGLTKA